VRGAKKRLDKLAAELGARRLAVTVDPLARAQLKEAIGVPLDEWSMAELLALGEHFEPGYTARLEAEEPARSAEADHKLASMSAAEILARLPYMEHKDEAKRNPALYRFRRERLAALAEEEAEAERPSYA
jgi:hypothetical protein